MKILYLLIIIHSSGNEIVGDYPSRLECEMERANMIEARHYKKEFVVCRLVNVTEQQTK